MTPCETYDLVSRTLREGGIAAKIFPVSHWELRRILQGKSGFSFPFPFRLDLRDIRGDRIASWHIPADPISEAVEL